MKQAMSGFTHGLAITALMLAGAWAGAEQLPQIDGRYEDWEAVPALFDFFEAYAPPGFRRESYVGGVELLPMSEARHWEQGGSALSEVKVLRAAGGVYLYAALRPPIQAGLSIFIYLHGEPQGEGAEQPNDLTLELVPAEGAEPGLVVLWQREGEPAVVGELVAGTHFLEAGVDWARLPPGLRAKPPQLGFFDLTTVFFDRRELAYEEFYWASCAVQDIPSLAGLQAAQQP